MLQAEHLVVKHPITGKTLDLRAPLRNDFEVQLAQLGPDAVPVGALALLG